MSNLWRAQALLRGFVDEAMARVWIPAMEAGHDEHVVSIDVVPAGTRIGGRFHLRCTLDHDDFAVAAERTMRFCDLCECERDNYFCSCGECPSNCICAGNECEDLKEEREHDNASAGSIRQGTL
jgi:hypothetical protein